MLKLNKSKQTIQNTPITEDLAYFIGVLHSDGCTYKFHDKQTNKTVMRLNLQIGEKSLPMAKKFKKILLDCFNRTVNIRQRPNSKLYSIQTSINQLWDTFSKWENYGLPAEISQKNTLFGAYLAGLIDGDGYIKIKKSQENWRIPQCVIKIASDHPLRPLKALIETHLGCKVHFEYDRQSKGVDTNFYISKKNKEFITEYVYPHISLTHKITTLKTVLKKKK